MATLIMDLESLKNNNSDLTTIKKKAEDINNTFTNSYLNSLPNSIGSLSNIIKKPLDRYKDGFDKSSKWFTEYLDELETLEKSLADFTSQSINKPTEFTGKFEDLFSKVTMPFLKTNNTLEQYYALAGMQTGGHIDKGTFTASNGVKMSYLVYVPEFSNGQTSGLPITCYLHGDSGYSHGVTSSSLPKLLTKKGLNVPGIVIMPQSNKDRWWESPRNMDTAAELTKYLAQKYNCDMSRVSACGHSNGGCGVHHMVAAHPDIFSSYVSSAGATGKNKKFQAIGKNHIYTWGIHGNKDKNVAYSKKNGVAGKQTYERLAAIFPEGTEFTTLEGRDHFIQDEVWTMKLNYKGKTMTPLEFLFTTKKWGSA